MSKKIDKIRREVAKLWVAAGCGCCRDDQAWEEQTEKLGELLDIPKFEDGSGYDFYSVGRKIIGENYIIND